MEVVYALGEASVSDVRERLPDPPSYSAVRTMMRLLEEKGLLSHRRDGTRYIYAATRTKETAARSALKHLVKAFFGNSTPDAVAALLDASSKSLTAQEIARIEQIIREAKKRGQ